MVAPKLILGGGALALIALFGAMGCNDPAPVTAFRSSVFIGERGISVPLPPPSLTAEPTQEVEVQGVVEDPALVAQGSVVHLVEVNTEFETTVELEKEAPGFVAALELDLSQACLEVWIELPDGRTSTTNLFSTRITADDTVEVVTGCEDE